MTNSSQFPTVVDGNGGELFEHSIRQLANTRRHFSKKYRQDAVSSPEFELISYFARLKFYLLVHDITESIK